MIFALFESQTSRSHSDGYFQDLFLHILLEQQSHFANRLIARLLRNFIDQQPDPSKGGVGIFMSAYSLVFSKNEPRAPSRIADKSILLLLLVSVQKFDLPNNAFQNAIKFFRSVQDISPTIEGALLKAEHSHISFKQIFEQISKKMEQEEITIFLYLMIQRNLDFKIYVLSRTDPETFVVLI